MKRLIALLISVALMALILCRVDLRQTAAHLSTMRLDFLIRPGILVYPEQSFLV